MSNYPIDVNLHLQNSLEIFDKNAAAENLIQKDKGWKVPCLMPIRVQSTYLAVIIRKELGIQILDRIKLSPRFTSFMRSSKTCMRLDDFPFSMLTLMAKADLASEQLTTRVVIRVKTLQMSTMKFLFLSCPQIMSSAHALRHKII